MEGEKEVKNKKRSALKNPIIQTVIGVFIIFVLLAGFLFWEKNNGTVYIDNSQIEAPITNLSSTTPGILNALYVKDGQKIGANEPVALIGTNTVLSRESGIIVGVENNIGQYFNPGQTVVSMIHPEDLRDVATIDENKGLDKIKVGQQASFTVDAFGNKIFYGVVDSINQTANDTGVTFTISDKRPTEKFNVKIRFDVAEYPELKDGMSAKTRIYLK